MERSFRRKTMLAATYSRVVPKTLRRWLQRFVTYVTSVPFYRQRLRVERTAKQMIMMSTACFLTAVVLGGYAVTVGWWWLLPIVWIVVIHTAQVNYWDYYHMGYHGTNPWRRYSIWAVVLFLGFNYREFVHHTDIHHNPEYLMRAGYDTAAHRMIKLPVLPFSFGHAMRSYWFRLAYVHLFHLVLPLLRLYDNLRYYPIKTVALWGGLLTFVAITQSWAHLFWVFLVPIWLWQIPMMFVGFNEHHFPADGTINGDALAAMSKYQRVMLLTSDAFLGEDFPYQGNWIAKGGWWFRLCFWYFPWRYMVIPGSTSVHLWHHFFPDSPHWPNALFYRDRMPNKLKEERWSPIPIMAASFDAMAVRTEFVY